MSTLSHNTVQIVDSLSILMDIPRDKLMNTNWITIIMYSYRYRQLVLTN